MTCQHLSHPFPPVYDAHARILLLGSFPSVKSRENAFYYGHPRNRFWPVLAAVLGCPLPETVSEKKRLLLDHHIALWDVIACCDIAGSDDSSIQNAVPNDLTPLLRQAPIRRVYTNGQTACRLYRRYLEAPSGIAACALPSTSPANAAFSLERLIAAWSVLGESAHG